MSGVHAISGVVYLGSGWLLYADPDLLFQWSENVAPALVLGSAAQPATLALRDGGEVSAPVLLHASGVWSQLPQRSAMAFLYVDPLSDTGVCLQRRALAHVVPWPHADLLPRHGLQLHALCQGDLRPDEVRHGVSAVLDEVTAGAADCVRLDPRLMRLRDRLHQHSEGRADPAAMASELGLSAEHVRKLFRQQVGMTLSSYLAWARLYQVAVNACDAQRRGQPQSATELVSAGGFYDASHATRAIRRYFDLLPTEMVAPRAFVDCRGMG
jgi:AraC-like DNA-binding protein